ncbi:MAG: hypothetical protein KC583_06000 [Myxococcales bacterium]|nr:hypothetical protein [Myxococcales bacterium]
MLLVGLGLPGAALAAPQPDVVPTLTPAPDGGAQVLVLHARACMLLEGEAPDPVPLKAGSTADCQRLNRAMGPLRQDKLRRLRVKAGTYVIRLLNVDVPWPIDFAIEGAHDPSLPKHAGGKIAPGEGADFRLELKPGIYVYRSPLNATLDYRLLVEN